MRIWSNLPLSDSQWLDLTRSSPRDQWIRADQSSDATGQLSHCDAAFGRPSPQELLDSPSVRMIQIRSAGYAEYDNPALRQAIQERQGALASSSSVFAEPCAQHLHAMILAVTRGLAGHWQNQLDHRWQQPTQAPRLLNQQHVLLVGLGAISRRLIELLTPCSVQFAAVRQHIRGNEPFATVTPDEIDPWLQWADHIVNTLPGGPSTTSFFNADRLAKIRPSAWLYNIGRGTTVDQHALNDALRAGQLAGAYLDVTDPEPLDASSPLWDVPNCLITPHVAGTHDTSNARLITHFVNNLRRWKSRLPLVDQVM